MSFFDALLLDEYRDPRDLWISQRDDGQQSGSGTVSDPANGATTIDAPQFITTPVTYDNLRVLIRTSFPHGYASTYPGTITLSALDTRGRSGRGPWYGVPLSSFVWVSEYAFTCQVGSAPEAPLDAMYEAKCPSFGGGTSITALLFWPVARVDAPNHGFSEYEAIRVEAINPVEFNCAAIAVGVDSNKSSSFFYRLAKIPQVTSGVGGKVSKIRFRFDEVMRKAPASSLIRLGTAPPSKPFQTRGICSAFFCG